MRAVAGGELALRPVARTLDYPLDLVAARPPGSRRRRSNASAGDVRRVVRGNTPFDLEGLRPWRLFGCSSLAVGADRTRTGGPLLARNLDFSRSATCASSASLPSTGRTTRRCGRSRASGSRGRSGCSRG